MVSVQSIVITLALVSAWLITTRLFVAIGATRLAVHKGRVGLWYWDHFKAEPKARRVPIEDARQQNTRPGRVSASPTKVWNRTNQNAAVIMELLVSRDDLLTLLRQHPTSYSTTSSVQPAGSSAPLYLCLEENIRVDRWHRKAAHALDPGNGMLAGTIKPLARNPSFLQVGSTAKFPTLMMYV